MALHKKLMLVVLALFVATVIAGYSASTTSSRPGAPMVISLAGTPAEAATATPPPVQKAGDPKAPVKLVAFYPLNKDHKPIADYVLTLPKKFGEKKVYAEVYDMQSPEGQKKWSTSGLSCAGVFVNGKTHWEVMRGKKKESVDFIKRMGSFWSSADLEAVVKSQLTDPKKIPVVPTKKVVTAEDKRAMGDTSGRPLTEKPKPAPKGK